MNAKRPDQSSTGDSGLTPSRPSSTGGTEPALSRIGAALRDLRYGSVLVIVQDGVVVQIERTEKTRLGRADR